MKPEPSKTPSDLWTREKSLYLIALPFFVAALGIALCAFSASELLEGVRAERVLNRVASVVATRMHRAALAEQAIACAVEIFIAVCCILVGTFGARIRRRANRRG